MTKPQQRGRKHHALKVIAAFVLIVIVGLFGWWGYGKLKVQRQQTALAPFYSTENQTLEGAPGELIRSEPIETTVEGGDGYRILYRTQRKDGSYTFSSGMVFIPTTSTNTPRPVVAWAHGTLGMGDACAPSRTTDPAATIPGLAEMLQRGWVVTATDYAGLGTAGTEGYLVGQDEAYDVLNSVRAAKQLTGTNMGNDITIWGHSQGGHSALFSSSLAHEYAPEFTLKGTIASAPAAELKALLDQQGNGSPLNWVIGPEVMLSWPEAYPDLSPEQVLSKAGQKNYKRIAEKCIEQASEEGLIRSGLKQQFFSQNPMDVPVWEQVATEQPAPILQPNQPLLVVESTADQVVLPSTTALYIERACEARSNLASLWLAEVGHIKLAPVSAPQAIAWLSDRFENRPNISTCNQVPPVAPATP